MQKSRFDDRTVGELVETLKSQRTDRGDTVEAIITFKDPYEKPELKLIFSTTYPELMHFPKEEILTDWLPDKPGFYKTDDEGNRTGEFVGHRAWQDYIDQDLLPQLQYIFNVGARNFSFKLVDGVTNG